MGDDDALGATNGDELDALGIALLAVGAGSLGPCHALAGTALASEAAKKM